MSKHFHLKVQNNSTEIKNTNFSIQTITVTNVILIIYFFHNKIAKEQCLSCNFLFVIVLKNIYMGDITQMRRTQGR